MTFLRTTVLCVGLASAVAALGCAAQQRLSMPTDTPTANGLAMPLCDGSAYYNAVKDRWFGLGDYATDQPGRYGGTSQEMVMPLSTGYTCPVIIRDSSDARNTAMFAIVLWLDQT